MNFTVTIPAGLRAPMALNRCGYATLRDRRSGETSYVRRLGSGFYPRFHVYLHSEAAGRARLSLHLDQKQPSYEGSHAHSGEYDGPEVEAEAQRIAAQCEAGSDR